MNAILMTGNTQFFVDERSDKDVLNVKLREDQKLVYVHSAKTDSGINFGNSDDNRICVVYLLAYNAGTHGPRNRHVAYGSASKETSVRGSMECG